MTRILVPSLVRRRMDVVVVGSMGYDAISTPKGSGEDLLGGSATYAGIAASFAAPKVGVVGVVGHDFKAEDRDLLEARGIDLAGLMQGDGSTFRWWGSYEGTMDEATTLRTDLNVLGNFDPKVPETYRHPSVLLCANLHPLVQASVLEQVTARRLTMLDSMNLWIELANDDLLNVLGRVDIVVLNDAEVRSLGARGSTAAAAVVVKGMLRPDATLIVKRGEHGAYVLHPTGPMVVPAVPSPGLVDPTGCGDSFAGTIAAELAKGTGPVGRAELRSALEHASVVASFTLETVGVSGLLDMDVHAKAARLQDLQRLSA